MCVNVSSCGTQILRHRRLIAHRYAVASMPAVLDVRRLDDQPVTLPAARREPHPRMRRITRRMRPTVHPDRARLLVSTDVVLVGDDFLRARIALGRDAQVQRAAIAVRRHVHAALLLRHAERRRVPALGELPSGVGQRDARVVAEADAGAAIGQILVPNRAPVAFEIGLRHGRRCAAQRARKDCRVRGQASHHRFPPTH